MGAAESSRRYEEQPLPAALVLHVPPLAVAGYLAVVIVKESNGTTGVLQFTTDGFSIVWPLHTSFYPWLKIERFAVAKRYRHGTLMPFYYRVAWN